MSDSDDLMVLAAQSANLADNGTCAFDVAGAELVADPAGIVFWPGEQLMIVSDLHLEKGSSFARRGQMLPPYDTGETLDRLQQLINDWQPRTIISLGDSFHDKDASARLPLAQRQQLQAMIKTCEWVWIEGNHDPEPPVNLGGMAASALSIGPLHFCHEPQVGAMPGEISGHLHPAAKLKRQGRSIRRRCFATSTDRLIMPSFGAYTGGLNVLDKAYGGLFENGVFSALMLGDGQVYRFSSKHLSR